MIMLTKENIAKLPKTAFADAWAMRRAISDTYACGITIETATKIIEDFTKSL